MNSKKLMLILLIVLVFLGGLGVGKGLYRSKPGETPQFTKTEKETPPERIYYIEDGETYPGWRKFKNKAVGYSIEYSPESSLVLNSNGGEVFIITAIEGIDIRLSSNSGGTSLRAWVDMYRPEIKRKVIKGVG